MVYIILTASPGCPSMLRADRGSENSIVAFLQPCLRHEHLDDHAKENSFQYGRSSANQVGSYNTVLYGYYYYYI